jgi:hypothetical protein
MGFRIRIGFAIFSVAPQNDQRGDRKNHTDDISDIHVSYSSRHNAISSIISLFRYRFLRFFLKGVSDADGSFDLIILVNQRTVGDIAAE